MSAIFDEVSGIYLPTLVATKTPLPITLQCACDMCYDADFGPITGVGPHDLHCICPPCSRLALDECRYDSYLESRYPDLYDDMHHYNWHADLEDGEIPPPNSPTNKEMHALNGNIVHDKGNQEAIDRQLSEARRDLLENIYDGTENAKLAPEKFHHRFPLGPALDSARSFFLGSEKIPQPDSEEILDFAIKKDPFMLERINAKRKADGLPKLHLKTTHQKPAGKTGSVAITDLLTGKSHSQVIGIEELKKLRSDWSKNHPSKPMPQKLIKHFVADDLDTYLDQESKDLPPPLPMPPPVASASVGPSNKEMHMINGNIQGPANKGVHPKHNKKMLRKLKRKLNKAKKKQHKEHPIVLKTIQKSIPKKDKIVLSKEVQQKRLAIRYARCLQNPSVPFPRLGSTGNLPTKIVRGFYEATFSMAAPNYGGITGLTNVTDCILFLSPKMFASGLGGSATSAPINLGFAVGSTIPFVSLASNATFSGIDFLNNGPLKNETGAATAATNVPMTRYLGGHVSLICRCPVSTTAPPFMYGGLLPENLALNNGTGVDFSTQLNSLTSTAIRALNCTKEVPGMEVSCIYVPNSAKSLDFSPNICTYQSGNNMDITSVPYVGFTGCPTTATVTVLVSAWYEIQQTSLNMSYAGFRLGPKLEAENVFDFLPKINPVKARALSLGTKDNAGSASVASQMRAFLKPVEESVEVKLDHAVQKLKELNSMFKELQIKVPDSDEEEEYKYFDSGTPINTRNLSRSTIDLALQLKDKLTPGSVTAKTSRSSLP